MKNLLEDFKKFITRGNVLDLAVGVIIGAAFQKIVSSLVNDIIMPLISWIVKVDIVDWVLVLKAGVSDGAGGWTEAPILLKYGNFIQAIIDFLIIAAVLFIIVKVAVTSSKARQNLNEKIVRKIEETKTEKKEAVK